MTIPAFAVEAMDRPATEGGSPGPSLDFSAMLLLYIAVFCSNNRQSKAMTPESRVFMPHSADSLERTSWRAFPRFVSSF